MTTDEYQPKDSKTVHDAKGLTGATSKQYGLHDYAHNPSSKFHPEQSLNGNCHEYVLHYHPFKKNLERVIDGRLLVTEHVDIYMKY